MKVLLVNGGPHPKGCTNRALEEVEKALKDFGVEDQKEEVKRWYDGYVLEMLMCDKVTHKKLIDSNLLFRKISRNLLSKMIQYNSKKIFF